MKDLIRIVKETAVGLAGSITPNVQRTSQPKLIEGIVSEEQRHPLHESIQLLNRMRETGGVRRIAKSAELGGVTIGGDNGVPIEVPQEHIMRHTDLGSLNEHIKNGTDYDPDDAPTWGRYGPVMYGDIPGAEKPKPTVEQVHRAAASVNGKPQIRTLQDELFGG